MALQKQIISDNGVPTTYHRIVSLVNMTNWSTMISVASYIDKEQRDIEATYQEIQKKDIPFDERELEEQAYLEKGVNVYYDTKTYSLDYDENMSVKKAYEYLKTLDEFKDSKDV